MTPVAERPVPPLAAVFEQFFATKTACDVDATMAFFSPDLATYTDATLGWNLDSYQALRGVFEQYMPGWAPPARSYATGIHSNDVSALVYMVDTPELFGAELRILAAVDFRDGKIIRWIDYWDAAAYPDELYASLRTPDAQFPRDLKDDQVDTQAAPELVAAATALQHAFAAGDTPAAAELLHNDVVFSDRSMRTHHIGRIETTRYLDRILPRRALRPGQLPSPHRRRRHRRRIRMDRRTQTRRPRRHHRHRARQQRARHHDHHRLRLATGHTDLPSRPHERRRPRLNTNRRPGTPYAITAALAGPDRALCVGGR